MTDCEVIVKVEREQRDEEAALREKPRKLGEARGKLVNVHEAEIDSIMQEFMTPLLEKVAEPVKVAEPEIRHYEPAIVIEREAERSLVWGSSERFGDICSDLGMQRYSIGDLRKEGDNYFVDVTHNSDGKKERVEIKRGVLDYLIEGRRAEEFRGLVARAEEFAKLEEGKAERLKRAKWAIAQEVLIYESSKAIRKDTSTLEREKERIISRALELGVQLPESFYSDSKIARESKNEKDQRFDRALKRTTEAAADYIVGTSSGVAGYSTQRLGEDECDAIDCDCSGHKNRDFREKLRRATMMANDACGEDDRDYDLPKKLRHDLGLIAAGLFITVSLSAVGAGYGIKSYLEPYGKVKTMRDARGGIIEYNLNGAKTIVRQGEEFKKIENESFDKAEIIYRAGKDITNF